jgi:hypothetical protein
MTVPQLDAAERAPLPGDWTIDWSDPDTGCTLVAARPSAQRDLWMEYLDGAHRSYAKHRLEHVLDLSAIRNGHDTALFFAAVDDKGRVVGGTRVRGPLLYADDSPALVEWAGQPSWVAVRKMIADRVPFGVAEMKSAWVTDDPNRNTSIIVTLARTPLHAMALLDLQFAMATSASHALGRWCSSGAVVASRIPATPYPDDRYRTKMVWWDRSTFVNHAEPKQVSKALGEMAELTRSLHRRAEFGARHESVL